MTFFKKVGNFAKTTILGVTTQDIILTFDPKLVILTVSNRLTPGGDAIADQLISHGFSDGTNDRCISAISQDNTGLTKTRHRMHNDATLIIMDNDGNIISKASVTMGTGKFTLNFTSNDAVALLIGYTAIGGTTPEFEVGGFAKSTALEPVAQNVTTILKSADGVLLMTGDIATENTSKVDIVVCVGAASGPAKEGCVAVTSEDGQFATDTSRIQKNDRCIMIRDGNTGGAVADAELTALDAVHGIQLNWVKNDATANMVYYCLMKNVQCDVGFFGTELTVAPPDHVFDVITPFDPDLVLTNSVSLTAIDILAGASRLAIGASDGVDQFLVWTAGADNVGVSQDASVFEDTLSIEALINTSTALTLQESGKIAMGIAKFTVTLIASDALERQILYMAIAESASGGSPNTKRSFCPAVIG